MAKTIGLDAVDSLLDYWFGNEPDDAVLAAAKAGLWWGGKAETDAEIAESFRLVADLAVTDTIDHWTGFPRGRLALILALDQLPRAIHRGTPRAFAQDAKARAVARGGLESGVFRLLRPVEQLFAYLPFEHSESLEDQDLAVELIGRLASAVRPEWRATFAGFLGYAERHRDVIRRFGRFPHRNAVLGRESTADEAAYLAEPGAGF
jgi:uncharacterized protein (DUF924 family)